MSNKRDEQSPVNLDAGFTSTENNGVVTLKYNDDNAYFNSTEIPDKTLKEVAAYNTAYITAAATAGAKAAETALTDNADTSTVLVNLPFSASARGNVEMTVHRSKTYPGMNGSPSVTKSAIGLVVKDPFLKVKSHIKHLESELTAAILG